MHVFAQCRYIVKLRKREVRIVKVSCHLAKASYRLASAVSACSMLFPQSVGLLTIRNLVLPCQLLKCFTLQVQKALVITTRNVSEPLPCPHPWQRNARLQLSVLYL